MRGSVDPMLAARRYADAVRRDGGRTMDGGGWCWSVPGARRLGSLLGVGGRKQRGRRLEMVRSKIYQLEQTHNSIKQRFVHEGPSLTSNAY